MPPSNTLKPGTTLHWYQIEGVLGHGGFGLTYLAHDTNLDQKVAIKEYLPSDLADRESDSTVRPKTENHEQVYAWGLDRFIKEARTLVQFKHPNIVRVMSVFEANNTAYMVMEYEHGQDLEKLMRQGKYRSEAELKQIVYPILEGLVQVHEAGFIHRDIKPGNIYIREDGSPVLLDFGSARQSVGGKTQAMTSLYTPGFAPFEQYHEAEGRQGPWTDVYSLGATLYLGATGQRPADALKRSAAYLHGTEDPYVPVAELAKGKFSRTFLGAIDRALSFREDERPQDTQAFKLLLEGKKMPAKPDQSVRKDAAAKEASSGGSWFTRALAATFVLAGIGLAAYWWQQQPAETPGLVTPVAQSKLSARPATTMKPVKPDSDPIRQLLEQAKADMNQGRLIAPRGQNALDRYREILKLAPDNLPAKDGLEAITGQVISQIQRVIDSGQYERAQQAIQVAEQSLGLTSAISSLKEQLTQAREEEARMQEAERLSEAKKQQLELERRRKAEEEQAKIAVRRQQEAEQRKRTEQEKRQKAELNNNRQQSISRLLVSAVEDIAAGRLANSPDGNDALSRYQQILKIDPANAAAIKGIATLTAKLAAQPQTNTNQEAAASSVSVAYIAYGSFKGEVEQISRDIAAALRKVSHDALSSKLKIADKGEHFGDNFFIDSSQEKTALSVCGQTDATHLLAATFDKSSGFSEYFYVYGYHCDTQSIKTRRYEIFYEEPDSSGIGGGGPAGWMPGIRKAIKKFLLQERPFSI